MQSTQITLHNIRRSPALSARIRDLAERLQARNREIIHIRVCVSHGGMAAKNSGTYCVTLRVRIPGQELAASHESDDVYLTVREAFLAMRNTLVQAAEAARRAAWAATKAATEP